MTTYLIADIRADGSRSAFWGSVKADSPEGALETHVEEVRNGLGSAHGERLRNEDKVRFVVALAEGLGGTSVSIIGLHFFDVERIEKTIINPASI